MRFLKTTISWKHCLTALWALSIVVMTCGRARPDETFDSESPGSEAAGLQVADQQAVAPQPADPKTAASQMFGLPAGDQGDVNSVGPPDAVALWKDWPDKAPGPPVWSIDYRFRSLMSSSITNEFGTPWPPPDGWSPMTRLNFPLNSNWHGVEARVGQPTWEFRLEWMMPQQGIHGEQNDFDWQLPTTDFTDMAYSSERWNEGQMLDFGFDFQMLDHPFGLPGELWPTIGFRWQRFDISCYDAVQVKANGDWLDPPQQLTGDTLAFNQQFYFGYIGGQLRGNLNLKVLPPFAWKFQGDWGVVGGYNSLTANDSQRESMNRTYGNMWHVAFTTEMPITQHFSIGVQFDYTKIQTHGTHRLNDPSQSIDESWDNGVSVLSDQTMLTTFLRLRI
jgi:hypothetical protein